MKRIAITLAAMSAIGFCQAISPVHNKVIEYLPAPGQFINVLPEWEDGDDAEAMCAKVLAATTVDESMICLGAYGGYVTFGFEKTIVNAPDCRDIYIQGNAFTGSSEPGIVMVAYDINGNGKPDENEWFEIAGSEYKNSVKNFEITYYKPATDTEDIKWTDNQGYSGVVPRNSFHNQPYWPQWVTDEKIVFKGTCLPDNAENQGTETSPYYVLKAYDFGYADNQPNLVYGEYNPAAMIDIDWAVDKNGNSVKMPGVDFVRIYTGINKDNGWIGDCSTEVCKVMNAHIVTNGREESVDESIKIDETILKEFLAAYGGQGAVAEMTNDNLRLYINSHGIVTFYLNEPAVAQVFDAVGCCRLSENLAAGNGQINLSNLEKGLYIIKVGKTSTKVLKR